MPPKKNASASTLQFLKSLEVEIADVKDLQQVITPEVAEKILGVRKAKDGEAGVKIDLYDHKVVFANNDANRPFSLGLAKQYGTMIFKSEWAGQKKSPSKTSNGEPIIIGAKRKIVSGAHRAAGVLIAEGMRLKFELMGLWDKLKEAGQQKGKPVSILAPIIGCVDPASADSVDTGKSRKLDDVLFRRNEFSNGKELSENAKKQLSKALSVALRLVWLRFNGMRVARGPKLHHPEAVSFLEENPLLHDAVLHVWECNGGSGSEGGKVSDYMTLGYAAGLMYLAAYCKTDRSRLEDLDRTRKPSQWSKAEEFFSLFAEDCHAEMNVIKALHKLLEKNRLSENKYSRDAVCTLVTRAWLSWTGETDKWANTRALATGLYSKEDGKEILNFERFGGCDLDREVLAEMDIVDDDTPVRTSVDTWKVGDTVWVDQPDVEPWFGRIERISDDGTLCHIFCTDDDEEFQAKVEWLVVDKPEREEEDELDDEVVPAELAE